MHLNRLSQDYPEIIGEIRGYSGIRGMAIVNRDGSPNEDAAKEILARSFEMGVLVRVTTNII